MTTILAFDIEIARLIPETGARHDALGVSCAATKLGDEDPLVWHSHYVGPEGDYHDRMTVTEVRELIGYLRMYAQSGAQIVTWNGAGFDFRVLAEEALGETYYEWCREMASNCIDPMFEMLCRLGYPIGLAKVCEAMHLGAKEGMTGKEAPGIWRSGREDQERVLEYVQGDVRLTADIHAEVLRRRNRIAWRTTSTNKYREGKCELLPVREAAKIPKPNTNWMTDPQPFFERSYHVSWIEELWR